MTDYVLRVPAGILLRHFSSSSSPPSPGWNAPDHLCVHIVDWGSKTGRYCEMLAKRIFRFRPVFVVVALWLLWLFLLKVSFSVWFFFHVDQLLVQLIFHFNSYHPAATCYNQTSSKLDNAETVGIYLRGGGGEGGLELQAEYAFLKQWILSIRLYDWPIAQIS